MVYIKRKVIQIANSTQLVSLPKKWADKYGVKKGDEIEVEERANNLIIKTEKDFSSEKTQIDFQSKEKLIHRALSSLYRSGYDEIKISFEKPSELEIIQSTINQELIGFEIIEQGRGYLIVKQVSNIEHSELDAMLKRTFIFLLSTSDECLEALKTNNLNILKNLIFRDITINKLTDYCRRSLNKRETYFKHVGPGYALIELLEKISDGYRDICKYVVNNKIKISKSLLSLLMEINILMRETYKLFYSFNLKDMENFLIQKEKIDKEIEDTSKNVKKEEVNILLYLSGVANNIFYLNGPLMINSL